MILLKDLGTRRCGKNTKRFGLFACPKCKAEKEMRVDYVKQNKSGLCQSCSASERATTHYDTNTRLYGIWGAMKYRATSNKVKNYKHISICEEWKTWTNFRDWSMANGYNDSLSIDRIDNNGNYEPNNCRWTNMVVQANNQRDIRSTNTSGYKGITKRKENGKWTGSIMYMGKRYNIGCYDTILEAVNAYNKCIDDNMLNKKKLTIKEENGI